jgi:cell pole-organizing protein PopZ
MATASSAQREPSMEEILASIRRIIEDSDGGRRPAGDVSEQLDEAEQTAGAETGAAEADAGEVEVFRSELRAVPIDPDPSDRASVSLPTEAAPKTFDFTASEPAAASATRPTSLAELGARVAAGESFDAAATRLVPETAPEIEPDIEPVGSDRFSGRAEPVQAFDADASPSDEPQVEIDDDDLLLDEQEDQPAATAAPRPTLVSEQTGRQVAAAFGELSEAFASRSKKSFDEMAEEMLRPMLQDWLDNNLPTLVERLVREEIERVARGAG